MRDIMNSDGFIKRLRVVSSNLVQVAPCGIVKDGPTTAQLCSVIEAIFLHELQKNNVNRPDSCPSRELPSFWTVLRPFASNRFLSFISTAHTRRNDIGCCRVWIRFALNEGSLHNELSTVFKDKSKITPFYRPESLMLDKRFIGDLLCLLQPLDAIAFSLDLSSPLLNTWKGSLALPWLMHYSDKSESDDAYSLPTVSAQTSSVTDSDLELIRTITRGSSESNQPEFLAEDVEEAEEVFSDSDLDHSVNMSASCSNSSKIVDLSPPRPPHGSLTQPDCGMTRDKDQLPINSNNIARLTQISWSVPSSTPRRTSTGSGPPEELNPGTNSEHSWQIINDTQLEHFQKEKVIRLVQIYPGADGFQPSDVPVKCALCEEMIVEPKNQRLDYFDARIYCCQCHLSHMECIPRNIVQNWDFEPHPVSEISKHFLRASRCFPWIDLAVWNPTIFAVSASLRQMRLLRRVLSLLWHLISNCDLRAADALIMSFKHRLHFLCPVDKIDVYSMDDLLAITTESLNHEVRLIIEHVALAHVYACKDCCRRNMGFCDLCQDFDRPIWVHDFRSYRRCTTPRCNRLIHRNCWQSFLHTNLLEWQRDRGSAGKPDEVQNPHSKDAYQHMYLTPTGLKQSFRCGMCRKNMQNQLPARIGHYADPMPD